MDTPEITAGATDRRGFLRCSACGIVGLAALAVPACGGGESATEPLDDTPKDTVVVRRDTTSTTGSGDPKWTVDGATVRIFLARVPELATIPGFLLIDTAQTLVIRTGAADYSAFTAVCTHEGCLVSGFGNSQLVCPCHGSTYNLNGEVVVGPAPLPLTRFATALDTAKNELLVTKST